MNAVGCGIELRRERNQMKYTPEEYAKKAGELFHEGYNCAQAVACSFCEEFGIDQETMFRVSEGFGLGMGMMDMCGAVTGMLMETWMEKSRVKEIHIRKQKRMHRSLKRWKVLTTAVS